MPKNCLPGKRSTLQEIAQAKAIFENVPLLRTFLDAVPNIILVLNDKRQIVFANRRLFKVLGCQSPDDFCGLRPGEVFNCIHATEAPQGCGTTEFCRTCGAMKAIVGSLYGQEMTEECRILRSTKDALEFRVWTKPISIAGQHFSIFALSDITHEKRRAALERLFFHDLLNLAGAIHGFSEYLGEITPEELEEVRMRIVRLTSRLIQEIRGQQLLSAAERGDLEVFPAQVSARALIHEIAETYRLHPVAQGRTIVIDPQSEDVEIVTDKTLLSRVIENMVKNGLEAIGEGQTVTLRCLRHNGGVRFEVHNPGMIPHEVQLQIFQRSYSTKGTGRGLGTYSIKLFAEKYLEGHVSFESSAEQGTIFRVDLPAALAGPLQQT
ncbi:MAG: PAS domain-containing sensor histidine kinase [Candidatus Sumerlaeaceae bacterium]